jgi:glycine C-acetyltransferase
MYGKLKEDIARTLAEIREAGLYKEERRLSGPQGVEITVKGRQVLNFCANNYLGLSSDPRVVRAAHEALDAWGYGLSSVRFICGTQELHVRLEEEVARFLGMDAAILYVACFDANGGVFEPLLGEQDAIITDALNHASIIDGIRLCKAQRHIYAHADMGSLEEKLKATAGARYRMIATDGVFSMDGDIANLKDICALAERHDALVMVDDSHATGFIGKSGRGTPEHCGVEGRIDVLTTTFGKALGGASGGCVAGHREIVDLLRQRSRPYLFSNTLAPSIAGGTLAVIQLLASTTALRDKLEQNTRYFREGIAAAGFEIKPGVHPIVPIMLYEAKLSQQMAKDLLDEGIYVTGFYFPVVPKGQARIRVQISAGHERAHLDRAIAAFAKVGRSLGVLK